MKRPIDIIRRLPKFGGYIAKKPGFALQAAKHLARKKLRGERLIQAIEYGVTYACQANCEKCSADKMHDPTRTKLTMDQIKALADDVHRLGAYEANFTGGEPLLDKNLEQIVAAFHPKDTFIGINTNGALIERERLLSLRDAGVDLFKISIDSPIAEEHDASRGIPGLYEHIFEVLRMIREIKGIRGHLCIVTTKDQVETGKVSKALDLAKQYDATLGLVFPSPSGGWAERHDIMLQLEHRRSLEALSDDPNVFMQGNLGTGKFVCPCGTSEIYITCYGDVIPCPFIQIAFGSVAEEPFSQIYRRMTDWKGLRGDSSLCRGAEDPEFIKKYTKPLVDKKQMPLRYNQHPNIEDES
jgi:MoaA/NifB/PqqE/SkfB family radical SAM enzyme